MGLGVLGARMLQPRFQPGAALPGLDPLGFRAVQPRRCVGQAGLGGGKRRAELGAFARDAGELRLELGPLTLESHWRIL